MVFFCASDLENELIETGKKFGIETFNGQKYSDNHTIEHYKKRGTVWD